MRRRLLLSFLGMMICMVAWCITEPEDGKYYRIVNLNPDKSVNTEGIRHGYVISENTISHGLTCVEPGADNKFNQIWKYTGGKFQNAHTQQSIQSNNSTSTQFATTKTGTVVNIDKKTKYFILTCGKQIHADGSNNIVAWNDENNVSNHWDFEEVTVDEAELAKVQAAYQEEQAQKSALEAIAAKAATFAPIVAGYFKDAACTELNETYAAKSDEQMKEQMTADGLPAQLQTVILRIKNKWSDELNPTLSERFRIQTYKCYTQADIKYTPKATQLSDQNNPTGIWTNTLQLMYVFVGDDIPEGTSLRIASSDGAEVSRVWWNNGSELKKGLNILYCSAENAYQWIMYTAPGQIGKRIDRFPAIKIHIEGGDVLGYADVAGKNEEAANAEYELTLKHATAMMKSKGVSTKLMNFAVKGERGLMLYPVDAYNQIWSEQKWNGTVYGYKIYKSMLFYDSVLKWEWSTMGWMERVENGEADNDHENLAAGGGDAWYPCYINNLAPTMMYYAGKNPYSSDGYTCMPSVGAIESSYNAERHNFDTWCVGHESGHNNQGAINLPSSTESSNNYFSNIITYLWGYKMSRGMTFMENMDYVQNRIVFPQRSISMTLRMYWNLYMYYHRAGKNKTFSQKLHKLLRNDPLSFGGEGWLDGEYGGANKGTAANSWLKFYEKACEAAGEDLTEYFRLWGFFIPTAKAGGSIVQSGNKYYAYCGDYSSYYIRCDQADIDAAIKRVKSKGYRENKEIMFIEDRLELQERTDIWAGKVGREFKETENEGYIASTEALKAKYGDLGYVEHYKDGKSIAAADYGFELKGTTVTLTGNGGGVGIIVYNEDGTIAYLSNRFTFDIPESVALSNYTIKVINADGSEVEAVDMTVGGKESQLTQVLQKVVDKASNFSTMVDETGTKVGYYLPSAIKSLNQLIDEAKQDIADKKTTEYVSMHDRLDAEMENVKRNGAKVQIEPTGVYVIKNNARGRYLTDDASTAATAGTDNAKWSFVTDAEGDMYMQNAGSLKLINGIYGVDATTLSASKPVRLSYAGNGCWYLYVANSENKEQCLNNTPSGEKVIGWSEDAGSQWYITKVSEIELVSASSINILVANTIELINKAGTVSTTTDKVALQVTDKTAPYYVATNRDNTSFPISNLVDGDKSTDFYTKKETTSSTPHNFYVDLGEGNETNCIRLTITTPNNGLAPKTIVVTPGESTLKYNVNQQTTWTNLSDGTTQTTKAYDSHETDKPYRYWRFQVTEVNGSTYPQFGLAEIQFRKLTKSVELNAGYEALDKNLVFDAQVAYKAAQDKVKALSTPLSNTVTYAGLKEVYDALYDAMEALVPTLVEAVDAEDVMSPKSGIYTLSGQKVKNITTPGIYIVGGKKIIMR